MSIKTEGDKWRFRGRCWKFGDNVGIDGDMMPLEFAIKRETNPAVLRDYLMTGIDPEFPRKVQPGDVIVGGRRFAQGNPHIQGFIGIRAHGLGLVVESMQRGSFRNAINAGVPFLTHCAGITKQVETGDELDVDFQLGTFINVTRGTDFAFKPLDRELLEIIGGGGWRPHLERRIASMASGARQA